MLIRSLDIDECNINVDGCDQNCHNTNGSYYCSCNSGYRLNIDNLTCDGMYIELSLNDFCHFTNQISMNVQKECQVVNITVATALAITVAVV